MGRRQKALRLLVNLKSSQETPDARYEKRFDTIDEVREHLESVSSLGNRKLFSAHLYREKQVGTIKTQEDIKKLGCE